MFTPIDLAELRLLVSSKLRRYEYMKDAKTLKEPYSTEEDEMIVFLSALLDKIKTLQAAALTPQEA